MLYLSIDGYGIRNLNCTAMEVTEANFSARQVLFSFDMAGKFFQKFHFFVSKVQNEQGIFFSFEITNFFFHESK